jgi:octaprenyl-diphosphate synthase
MTATLNSIAPAPADLEVLLHLGLTAVADRVDAELAAEGRTVQALVDHASRYRGKMLRPALALMSAAAARPALLERLDTDASELPAHLAEVVDVAAVIEIIHVATLVHDDVLDEAESRRGQPSVNAMNGNETAVMLGDYLFARSFTLCSRLPVRDARGTHTATRVGEITARVCRGEMLQLANRHNADLTAAEYFEIIALKTGELIAAAAELGALHACAAPEHAEALARFGSAVGTAFQIRDDLLDLEGDERSVGKPLGRDATLGKLTLPLIHHLASRNGAADALRAAVRGERPPIPRRNLITMLNETGSIAHARDEADRLINDAIASLLPLPASPARSYLEQLAHAVLTRTA